MRCNCKELRVIREHTVTTCSFSTTTAAAAAAAASTSKAFPVGEKYHRYAVIMHTQIYERPGLGHQQLLSLEICYELVKIWKHWICSLYFAIQASGKKNQCFQWKHITFFLT